MKSYLGMLIRSHRVYTILGIIFAVLAGALLLFYLVQVRRVLPKTGEMIPVPIAARDLVRGDTVADEDLSMTEWPENYLFPDTLRDKDEITGLTVTRYINTGEPITANRLVGEGDERDLAARIPPDMRAYTLPLDMGTGLSPAAAPGDRVDILVTLGEPPSTRTILSGKEILGLEEEPVEDVGISGGAVSLTLLLSPTEVETLTYARSQGDISLSLCSLEGASGDRR